MDAKESMMNKKIKINKVNKLFNVKLDIYMHKFIYKLS